MAQFRTPDHLSLLLQTYTHGQVRFIEEYGIEATNRDISIHRQIEALVLMDGSLIEPNEYQFLRTAENDSNIQLWEYPPNKPIPPVGKVFKSIEGSFRLVKEWPKAQIRWVLSPEALRRYKTTAPDVPEWDNDVDS